jgi:hypothetical protein
MHYYSSVTFQMNSYGKDASAISLAQLISFNQLLAAVIGEVEELVY